MTHFIIQTIAFQLLFLVLYDLFLRKETFFNWNRVYLLITPILSLVLPFIRIGSLREAIPMEYTFQLPAVIVGNAPATEQIVETAFQFPWMLVWITGAALSTLWFTYKCFRIVRIRRSSYTELNAVSGVRIIPRSDTAFTFFNTIYLGENLSEKQKTHILFHERIHVEERHTFDLILFELLRIVFWFNPLVYIFQKRISALHEFTADRKVARANERKAYYQEILSQVFQTESISFINTFFKHSLIKNRIIMLQKSNSKRIFQLKYLMILPIICGMLIYTSCAQETEPVSTNETNDFVAGTNTDIINDIQALKASIAAKGDLSEEEQKALKSLYTKAYGDVDNTGNLHFDSKNNGQQKLAFATIDRVPTFPGCEGLSNDASKKCFTQKVANFVVQNFNTKVSKDSEISGKQRIIVHFNITDTGKIDKVKAKAQHSELIDEAIRVIETLPEMIPGEHKGKKVTVEFALPIIFEMDE
ncbi:energy transducer TonB [Aureitalea sp. L0-47]|uniref:M56 family metallopeptidase n=1 Tax=Aureitalea sp. L0-47 TaxID=2816962 RepID=UPI0022370E8A|nr:M56 family metallopeptidase [Aureitalea sp. L0-47]MCW5518569.1 energy transducer TonB [Aureitalea sp. L0-47]